MPAAFPSRIAPFAIKAAPASCPRLLGSCTIIRLTPCRMVAEGRRALTDSRNSRITAPPFESPDCRRLRLCELPDALEANED